MVRVNRSLSQSLKPKILNTIAGTVASLDITEDYVSNIQRFGFTCVYKCYVKANNTWEIAPFKNKLSEITCTNQKCRMKRIFVKDAIFIWYKLCIIKN